jgi:hypothetical protein
MPLGVPPCALIGVTRRAARLMLGSRGRNLPFTRGRGASTVRSAGSHIFGAVAMTTSDETDWMNHPVIRRLIDQAAALTLEERITLVKGLIPGIADALSEEEYEQFVTFIRLKGERFLEAKSHPGEGRAGRQIPGERDLEGR